MPKKVERKLLLRAEKLGLKGERKKAYVFGTMRRIEKARSK
jgi:hypothetical protein